jgi:microcystin-dependent protein
MTAGGDIQIADFRGLMLPYLGTTAPTGWFLANGQTFGDASSGADHANAGYEDLFTLLWTAFADAQLPILTSAGGASTRGASAAADWAAHKRLTLPNLKGKVVVGYNAAETEFDAMGETGGEKTHTLTEAELPAHVHDMGDFNVNPANQRIAVVSASGGYDPYGGTPSVNTGSVGSDDAHNNLQPYFATNYIIKY